MRPAGGRLDRVVKRIEEIVFAVIVLIMVAMGLIPIILRYCSSVGVTGTEVVSRHLVLWIALLGAGAAVRERSSISIDAVSHLVPLRWRLFMRGFTEAISAVVCGTLVWISTGFIRLTAAFEKGALAFGIPEWCLTLILPIGLFLLTLRLLIAAAEDFREGWASDGQAAAPVKESS
jgi:TRAP-type C4-dicarboxylate transport system permease small subunit